jgi:putative transposase
MVRARIFLEKLSMTACIYALVPSSNLRMVPFADRLVLSIKSECLAKMERSGEAHLRRTVSEYLRHYHSERNHQGLNNELISRVEPANTNRRCSAARLGSVDC